MASEWQTQQQQPQEEQTEQKPGKPGTRDGELSPGGGWKWEGTGAPDDHWVAVSPEGGERTRQFEFGQQPEVTPTTAPVAGTAIASSATIDSLFTLAFGTRSADLSATPTYSWGTGTCIVANWPTVLSNNIINNSAMFCRFEARQMAPSTISQ